MQLRKGTPSTRISWKPVLFAVAMIPLNTYWIAMVEMVWSGLHFTAASLPLNVIFILFWLIAYSAVAHRISPKLAFSQADLMVVYLVLTTSSAVAGYDSLVGLTGILPHATWFATLENDWSNLFAGHLPTWLILTEKEVVRYFYIGEVDFYATEYWRYWLIPAISWTLFFFILTVLLMCITVLVRRPWTEQEKLTYPIIQLPLEMTHPKTRLFSSRLFWIGFSVAAIVDIINGLNYLYPSVPYIPVRGIRLDRYFTEKPWNAIGWTPIRFRFFMIGMTYLLPLNLSTSCWFFYIFRKIQQIIGSTVGWSNIPGYPFTGQQSMGALLGICIVSLFAINRHLRAMFIDLLRNREPDDKRDPMSNRAAVIGIVVCSLLLAGFGWRMGLSLWVVAVFFTVFLMMAVAMARIRAESGVPEHDLHLVSPQDSLVSLLGTRAFGPRNLAGLSLFVWFSRRKRNYLMPHQLEGFKIAERRGFSNRSVLWLLLFSTFVGILAAFAIFPHTLYRYGAEARADGMRSVGWDTFNRLSSWLQYPRPPDWISNGFLFGGVLFTFALTFLRHKFLWWPFHPAGYALANGFGIDDYWFTIFFASSIKWVVLRQGGARAYRRSLPFFFGLIVGDYILACAWALLGVILNRPMYTIWS
jgi:hypothetical protein